MESPASHRGGVPERKPRPKKALILELWGLGDGVMATGFLDLLRGLGWEVTLACKPGTKALLEPTFPEFEFICFDPPWTAYIGKYRLWKWPWLRLFRFVWRLRQGQFDYGFSVREDPRDHLLLWLAGASHRLSFGKKGSGFFLNPSLKREAFLQHRVEDWHQIAVRLAAELGVPEPPRLSVAPRLVPSRVESPLPANSNRPKLVLHCGARIPLRRWELERFRRVLLHLRHEFGFSCHVLPDLDGFGKELARDVDSCHADLSLSQMVAALGEADLVLCNDSAPGHVAAALGKPVIAVFGPTSPDWFRPFGDQNLVVIRDICSYRPCWDYCHFDRPICLEELHVEQVLPEIENHVRMLIRQNVLSGTHAA